MIFGNDIQAALGPGAPGTSLITEVHAQEEESSMISNSK
jgi:hypothetical protein